MVLTTKLEVDRQVALLCRQAPSGRLAHVTNDNASQLLDGARSGSDWAWRAIVTHYAPVLESFAASKGAEDPAGIANMTLVKFARSVEGFRGNDKRSLDSYVFRIARHRIIDEARKQRIETVHLPHEPLLVDPVASDIETAVATKDWVAEGLGMLSAEQRRVIELRILEDRSVTETALLLNKKPNAVHVLQHRALKTLRVVMAAAAIIAVVFGVWWARQVPDGLVDSAPASESENPLVDPPSDDSLSKFPSEKSLPAETQDAIESSVDLTNDTDPPDEIPDRNETVTTLPPSTDAQTELGLGSDDNKPAPVSNPDASQETEARQDPNPVSEAQSGLGQESDVQPVPDQVPEAQPDRNRQSIVPTTARPTVTDSGPTVVWDAEVKCSGVAAMLSATVTSTGIGAEEYFLELDGSSPAHVGTAVSVGGGESGRVSLGGLQPGERTVELKENGLSIGVTKTVIAPTCVLSTSSVSWGVPFCSGTKAMVKAEVTNKTSSAASYHLVLDRTSHTGTPANIEVGASTDLFLGGIPSGTHHIEVVEDGVHLTNKLSRTFPEC